MILRTLPSEIAMALTIYSRGHSIFVAQYLLLKCPLPKQYHLPGGQASQRSFLSVVEVLQDTPISTFSRRSLPGSEPGASLPCTDGQV